MRDTRDIMGMPVTVEIADEQADELVLDRAFEYFQHVDATFSTYKEGSEISRLNRGELSMGMVSDEIREVLDLAEETKRATDGYFDIHKADGTIDPSGIVKGWAIKKASDLLESLGAYNIYVEAGGDIQTRGVNEQGGEWRIGIRNPFKRHEVVKIIEPRGCGVATSGTAVRGQHIWNPIERREARSPYVSITVIGPDVYEADRFATAIFAMEGNALPFLSRVQGFEAYAIDHGGVATFTPGFDAFVAKEFQPSAL